MLELLLFAVAFLYASVGHAGASGYIAAMTLFGLSEPVYKPSSLALNILVAILGVAQFGRAGLIPWRMVPGFLILAIPAAAWGGTLTGHMPDIYYRPLLGCVLLFAAWRLIARPAAGPAAVRPPHFAVALAVGGAIGFLSGITSTGGGIFLSPVVVLFGWAEMRRVAGLSIVFILANSVSGLWGQIAKGAEFPPELWRWLVAVGLGGALGGRMGSLRFANPTLKKLLGVVLVIAAGKLFLVLKGPIEKILDG